MWEPTGKWVKPMHKSATGQQSKDMKITLMGSVVDGPEKGVSGRVKARGSKSLFLTEGFLSFFQGSNVRLPSLAQRKTLYLLLVTKMELNLSHLPADAARSSKTLISYHNNT
jgi:hypothetical protein